MKKIIVSLHSGSFYELEPQEAENLSKVISSGSTKFVKIKGDLVAVSGILNMQDSDKYYEQHPKKKPVKEPFFKNFSALSEPKTSYSHEKNKTRLEKMKAGFLTSAKVKDKKDLSDKQVVIFNSIESKLLKITSNK